MRVTFSVFFSKNIRNVRADCRPSRLVGHLMVARRTNDDVTIITYGRARDYIYETAVVGFIQTTSVGRDVRFFRIARTLDDSFRVSRQSSWPFRGCSRGCVCRTNGLAKCARTTTFPRRLLTESGVLAPDRTIAFVAMTPPPR